MSVCRRPMEDPHLKIVGAPELWTSALGDGVLRSLGVAEAESDVGMVFIDGDADGREMKRVAASSRQAHPTPGDQPVRTSSPPPVHTTHTCSLVNATRHIHRAIRHEVVCRPIETGRYCGTGHRSQLDNYHYMVIV